MSLNQVNLLVGMRDQSGQELDRGIALTNSVNAVLSAAGYFALETPVLEQVELFVRKSGGQSNHLVSDVDVSSTQYILSANLEGQEGSNQKGNQSKSSC